VGTPFTPEPVPIPAAAAGAEPAAPAPADRPSAAVPPPPEYRDRSTGLTVFGIIQIVLGLMAALFIPFMLLMAALGRRASGGMPLGNYFSAVLTYTFVAALFITLGVGSIRARRWAWALSLVLSWIWLVTGTLMTVTMTAVLPTTFLAGMRAAQANMGEARPMPTGVMAVILTMMIAVATVFLVVLPIIFVVFYRRKDVEETCKHRDPVVRWTDRCPLPVLAASLLFLLGAGYFFLLGFTTPMYPLFGRYLTGARATLVLIPLAVLDATLAYFLFQLRVGAWWVAMAAILLRLASAVSTFLRADLLQAYARMGWSDEQLRMMSSNPAMRSGVFLWWSLAFTVIFMGYMIWIKRYFRLAAAVTPTAGAQPSLPLPAA
jgi:hypothetical protein